MATKRGMNVDLNSVFEGAASQFRNLNPNEPGQWPMLPKLMTWGGLALAMVVLGWFLLLSEAHDGLEAERAKEVTLKADYRGKLAQAVNLGELRKQKLQVEEYVTQLEKQLPGKAEMDALLSDINQAGIGRGLQFELFRPAQREITREFYAERPITVKVIGNYHDMGAFASDVGQLSRIVTLNDVSISAGKEGMLTMDATARTFRYLDEEEIAAQRKAARKAPPKKR